MTKVIRWLWLVVGCIAASLAITVAISLVRQEDSVGMTDWIPVEVGMPPLNKHDFQPMVAADRFPPITKFPIVAGADAREQIGESELVIGVVMQGEARAYPINMLTGPSREILNDQLGGRAIAATW